MNGAARDSTEEWLLPESAKPPTIAALEQRIDTALAIARASEAAVISVADAALESAEQARRAAELAELAAQRAAAANGAGGGRPPPPSSNSSAPSPLDWLDAFERRAEQVGARLARLGPGAAR